MRVLHLQNWNADAIKENIPVVKEQGFDACLIGPVQPLKEDGYKEWWMSYQITDFKIGNIYISYEPFEVKWLNANELEVSNSNRGQIFKSKKRYRNISILYN